MKCTNKLTERKRCIPHSPNDNVYELELLLSYDFLHDESLARPFTNILPLNGFAVTKSRDRSVSSHDIFGTPSMILVSGSDDENVINFKYIFGTFKIFIIKTFR